jgi:hypothetical protein
MQCKSAAPSTAGDEYCLTVITVSRGVCSHNERHKILTTQTGYIPVVPPSSTAPGLVAPPLVAGTQRCPWRIVVDPLQRVRVILYAFGSRHHGQQNRQDDGQGGQGQGRGTALPSCPAFAVFDGAAERSLCQLNGARQMVLHTSESHQLTVHFRFSATTSDKLSPTSFMLYYEGKFAIIIVASLFRTCECVCVCVCVCARARARYDILAVNCSYDSRTPVLHSG